MESSPGNNGDDTNDTGWSQHLTKRKQLATATVGTLTLLSSSSNPVTGDDSLFQMSPPLPSLPFELITEILLRLPVKFLMTLKCVCKPWNALISSNRNFARKQLLISRMNPKLMLNFKNRYYSHLVYPLSSLFTNVNDTIIHDTHINYPFNTEDISTLIIGSCDGILCLIQHNYSLRPQTFIQASLWNPSTRKYKVLPAFDKPLNDCNDGYVETVYGFGFDHLIHNYKVVAVFIFRCVKTVYKTQVMVHTSGTDSWRLIDEFPFASSIAPYLVSGKFVSGTINWWVPIADKHIISLDLGTESYQLILPPDYGEKRTLNLGVSRDCLCVLAGCARPMVSDIWLMKEYGNTDSWTKLVTVPSYIIQVLYISEDDQMLLASRKMLEWELVVYDPINGTLKSPDDENFNEFNFLQIYVESLISPHS